jgi:hypothetical protein
MVFVSMEGWIYGWMDGWMDGCVHSELSIHRPRVLKVARTTHPSFAADVEEVGRLYLAFHRMSNRCHSAMGYFNVPWQKKEVTVISAEQPFTSLSGILKMHVIYISAINDCG